MPLTVAVVAAPTITPARAVEIELPELNDSTSGIISRNQEHVLGRTWLKAFRGQTHVFYDPETQQYIEQLIYKLSAASELEDHRLEIVVVDNPNMNAFAVPGGVIGAHTGLFQYAENEHQLASVFAHELAHLSQRHFARGVAERKKTAITTMAGLLAGLVLAATSSGDAGIAAITATQALAQDQQLRYSRQNEHEADRLGIQTMYQAGMDPAAVPAMFERMLRATRYVGYRVPEFLRSHPLTEKRVADASSRLDRYPPKQYQDKLDYHLIRARVQLSLEENPQQAIKRFRSELQGDSLSREAARYGLVLGLIETGQFDETSKHLAILQESGDHLLYKIAEISLLRAQGEYELATQLCYQQLAYHPNDYPLQMALAQTYIKATRYDKADEVLTTLSRQRPNDPKVWYELAEVRGLAGNISGLHLARAEYFILVGAFGAARDQLGYALKLSRHDFKKSSILEQRLRDLAKLEEQIEKL